MFLGLEAKYVPIVMSANQIPLLKFLGGIKSSDTLFFFGGCWHSTRFCRAQVEFCVVPEASRQWENLPV